MNKITKQEVMDFILTADNDVLVDLNELIRDCFKRQSSKLKYDLMSGDRVKIKGSNKIEQGEVIKVNRTRAVVRCYVKESDVHVNYNVPFTMITKIGEIK